MSKTPDRKQAIPTSAEAYEELREIDMMDIPDPASSDLRDRLIVVLRYLMHELN